MPNPWQVLREELQGKVQVISPFEVPVERLYPRIRADSILKDLYPDMLQWKKSLWTNTVILQKDPIWIPVDVFEGGKILRVHGIFLGNPFREQGLLFRIRDALEKAFHPVRMECILLRPDGIVSKGIERMLQTLGFEREGILRYGYVIGYSRLCTGVVFSRILEGGLRWDHQALQNKSVRGIHNRV